MKKFFTISLCLLAAGLTATTSAEEYKLVTSMDQLTNQTKFILVTSKPIDGKFYAAKTPVKSSSSIQTIELNVEGETLPETITIAASDMEVLGYFTTAKNATDTDMYLYNEDTDILIGGKSNNLSLTTSNLSKEVTYTIDEETHAAKIVANTTTNQCYAFMIWSSSVLFRNPTQTWIESMPDYAVTLPAIYVEVEGSSADPAPEFKGVPVKTEDDPYAYDLTLDETKALPAIEPAELEYTFKTNDNSIVTIDNDAKTITAVGAGTATIRFTTKAVEGKYAAGEGEFKVYVSVRSGVAEIGAASGEARYYDLNGREIKGGLDKGVYVRLQDGKATKIIVK